MFLSSPPTASTAGPLAGQLDRQRRVAAGPADRQLAAVDHPHHRVVARHMDRAVVVEHGVTERRKPLRGIVVGETDRFVGAVGAGQHQRVGTRGAGNGRQQQVMQGGVGQHQPEQRAAGRHGVGDRRAGAPAQQHDRAGGTRQHRGLGVVDVGVAARDVEVADQHRERLGAARLSCPQRTDRRLVVDGAGQVVAADSLDGDHRARRQRALGGGQRGIRSGRSGRPPTKTTATDRNRGRRSAARGTGGPPDRGIRRRTARTWRMPTWWWPGGRRAARG